MTTFSVKLQNSLFKFPFIVILLWNPKFNQKWKPIKKFILQVHIYSKRGWNLESWIILVGVNGSFWLVKMTADITYLSVKAPKWVITDRLPQDCFLSILVLKWDAAIPLYIIESCLEGDIFSWFLQSIWSWCCSCAAECYYICCVRHYRRSFVSFDFSSIVWYWWGLLLLLLLLEGYYCSSSFPSLYNWYDKVSSQIVLNTNNKTVGTIY